MNNVKGWYNLRFTQSYFINMFSKDTLWPQKLFILMIFGLFNLGVAGMISGCGNKGDLYLPDSGSVNDSKTNKPKKKS